MDRMRNSYLDVLTAILIAAGLFPDSVRAGTFTGEIPLFPASGYSRDADTTPSSWDTRPPELENPWLSPAAKVVAEECATVDVAALAGDDLIDYLRDTSPDCLGRTLLIVDNPSIRADVPTIFSNANMQSVFAEIEESAAAYDGTNSTGMLQLWRFVQIGYNYHRFYPEESGVGPFDAATDRAYLAASDAFAAADHFNAPNDEAAQILHYYFDVAFAAGLRRNHLPPIKKVLSGFTPERAASESEICQDDDEGIQYCDVIAPQRWAFERVLRRVMGSFEDRDEGIMAHGDFHQSLEQDPEFVDAMLQVTRYDFYFLVDENHPNTPRLGQLETVVKMLGRLTWVDSLREPALTALTSVLSWHERLSNPFLIAAKGLEDLVECESLNICRDVLEEEILAQAVPNTYRFDDGAILFQTSLDLEEVQPWYYKLKQVQAQFHRLVETDEVVDEDRDVFTARIYDTILDYTPFEAYLTGADTRGIHSGGVYSGGIMSTYLEFLPGDRKEGFEETLHHEYVHYLADRFGLHGGPWFDEGLAEFLVSSTQAEGVPVRQAQIRYIAGNETRLDPAGLFNSGYSGDLGGGFFYYYADLFFHFLHQQRRTQLLELFEVVRSGDRELYSNLIAAWAEDTQLSADFDSFLDEQIAEIVWEESRPSFIYTPSPAALTSDSAAEIESALQRIDGDLVLDCQTVATEPGPRFGCAGSLAMASPFDGNRGALNEHLNSRLDSLIVAAVEDGAITNFKSMNCYFANVAGSPPVADLYCEGPLRPMDVDWVPPQVDLETILINHSGDVRANMKSSLNLFVGLRFSEDVASNVMLTWTANMPLRLEEAQRYDTAAQCEIIEITETSGTFDCGHVQDGELEYESPGLVITMFFTPLQAGLLDFSVEFSADEEELEPTNNIQWLRGVVIAPDPNNPPRSLTKLSGDNQGGLPREDLPQPFTVSVLDQNGSAFTGAIVTFAVVSGDGTLSVETAATDTSGRAATTLTLGPDPGTTTVRATVAGLEPVVFTATGLGPRTLAKVSGDGQQEAAGAALAEPFVVSVLDQNGSAFPGATVNFAVTSGDGTLSATTATTDENGRAATTLTLGGDPVTNTVEVTVPGLDPVTFTATAEATPDFDGDGETGFSDFFLLADAFGGSDPRFDLDGSGSVDFGDFFLFADHFGDPARGKLLALAREMIGLPDGPQLQQNAPNPFNSETLISWFQLRPGPARVEVFALTGQRVAVLHQRPKKAGVHRVHWDGRDDRGRTLASGVYLYRLVTTESVQTRKLTLLR